MESHTQRESAKPLTATGPRLERCPFCPSRPSKTQTDWWFIRHDRECFIAIIAQRDMFIHPDQTSAWNSRISAGVIDEFRDTAIKAHIGFQHQGPWESCERGECKHRRDLVKR